MKYRIYFYFPSLMSRTYMAMHDTDDRLEAYEVADKLVDALPQGRGFGITIVPKGTEFDQGIHYDGIK